MIFKMALLFRQRSIHIVHTHAWGGSSLYGILGARLARVPIVINGEHGLFFTKPRQILAQRILFHLCDSNLAVSESLKIRTHSILGVPLNKITVIKNGVDTERFTGSYPKDKTIRRLRDEGFSVEEESFFVVSIGTLKPDKAQIRFLRAIKKICNDEPGNKIKFLFIGDGDDRTSLESFVENEGIKNAVVFLGHRSDIPELLSVSSILVSTSFDEGLSNVMLEAMSSGIPIISTRSMGVAELINDGIDGFLVEQEDAVQLAEKIMMLYHDKSLLQTMGKNAKNLINQRYSIKKMVEGYEHLYLKLAKEQHVPNQD